MADTQQIKKPVIRKIHIDASDSSKVREAILVDAVALVQRGNFDQTLMYQLADGALVTLWVTGVEVWRYYDGASSVPAYKVEVKLVPEIFCTQAAIDAYDRNLRAAL